MTDEERVELLNQYIDIMNSYESVEELEKSEALKDFETRHQGDAELTELMQGSRKVKILFLNGEIE